MGVPIARAPARLPARHAAASLVRPDIESVSASSRSETVAYLQTHAALTMPLAQPARFETPGAYPTQWSVTYDPKAQRYDVAFDALVGH